MLNPQLFRLPRRMQRIREQQQTFDEARLVGAQHRRLSSTIRMSAQKQAPRDHFAKRGNSILQTLTVASGVAGPGRTKRPALPIRQIAAQHGNARCLECLSQRHQQRSPRIRSRAMRKHQSVAGAGRRPMNKSPNLRIH
jgi:hypothetical protein